MKASLILAAITLYCAPLAAADYKSPYKVEFTFKEEDLPKRPAPVRDAA